MQRLTAIYQHCRSHDLFSNVVPQVWQLVSKLIDAEARLDFYVVASNRCPPAKSLGDFQRVAYDLNRLA